MSLASTVLHSAIGNTQFLSDLGSFADWTVNHGPLGCTSFGQILSRAGHWMLETAQKIDRLISDFLIKVIHQLADIFGRFNKTIASILLKISTGALSRIVGKVMGAIPGWNHLKTAAGLYDHARKAVSNAYSLFSQLWQGYDVNLLGGHPDIIASALARHSLTACATNVFNLTHESAKITISATDSLSGIGGTLFNALDSALMAVVKLIESKVQKHFLQKSLTVAKRHWDIRGTNRSMMYSHQAFSAWLRSAVIPCPILAALILNSGFVAHPYRFLRLLSEDGQVVSQSAYLKGVKYIEELKKISQKYITSYTQQYGFNFVGTDAITKSRMNELIKGKTFHTPPADCGYSPAHPLTQLETGSDEGYDDFDGSETQSLVS